jgi:tetratricopeptide (TPR) repeat protein
MDTTFLRQRALALWSEAQLCQYNGNLGRAIELYSRSIDIYPTAEAHAFRGWAYSLQNRHEDAIEECKRSIELDPGFGNPYNDIGSYLFTMGKLDEAAEWLEKAKNAPRYELRHYPFMNMGRIYATQGMILRAIREFEAALQLCPGDTVCEALLEEMKRKLH